MNKVVLILTATLLIWSSCKSQESDNNSDQKIQVGVFQGNGGAESCIRETRAAILIDPQMEVRTFTTTDIANGLLAELDAIIIPGGSGSRQYLNMGEENRKKIKEFVKNGGGAVGICAGAYLFSNTPEYASLGMNGAQAIDIEHDNRGHGMAKFTLTEEGKAIFPEMAEEDTLHVIYYEGPVFIKAEGEWNSEQINYTSFATMESDVHEEGNAPANMTNNKPFYIGNSYGKGKVFSSIAHPEATPGMMWMVPRMVRWTLDKPFITYKKEAMETAIEPKEILFSIADLSKESKLFKVLLYADKDEKIAALDWLEQHYSWDAKSWLQGLLYDKESEVRVRAAEYIARSHYIAFLSDLEAAAKAEEKIGSKESAEAIRTALEQLQAILPAK